jgi:hypothetical protein
VTLRAYFDHQVDANSFMTAVTKTAAAVKTVGVAQTVGTVDARNGITTPPATLVLTTTTADLTHGVYGNPYSVMLQSIGGATPSQSAGGVATRNWTILSGSVPGLTLGLTTGALSGTPTMAGTFPITVQVADTPPNTLLTQTDSTDLLVTIDPRPITATAVSNTKTYDGTTTSAAAPAITSAYSPVIVSGDSASFTQTFDNRNAGTPKTLTPAGAVIDNNGGNNYKVTFVPISAGTINPLPIIVTAVSDTKTYNGTTSSTQSPTIAPTLISPDSPNFTQTFNNRNAGTSKTLTPAGTVSDRNGGNNYKVTFVPISAGTINPLPTIVTAVSDTKPYDGTTSSTQSPTIAPTLISPDSSGFAQAFDSQNPGARTLTPAGSTIDGNNGNNYRVTFVSAAGSIVLLVANTNDSGAASLRQAILNVNAQPGSQPVGIVFNIPGNGVQTITPLTALPTLTHPAILDATTQAGYAGSPIIELNGSSAGAGVDGIHITAGNSTVRGFVINRFGGDGIRLESNGSDVILGNYVGTDVSGAVSQPNTGNGIQIIDTPNSTIGGTTSSTRNVISGNAGEGLRIDGALATGNLVQGNYIGTNASGSAAVGNSASGIYIRRAPSNSVIGNLVSGNLGFAGITICGDLLPAPGFCGGGDIGTQGNNGSGNIVQGNLVGTNSAGTSALGNSQRGVSIDGAPNTLVGGITAGARNVISFNGTVGVDIFHDGANGNKIQGNTIANNGSTVPTSATQPNAGIFVEAGTGNTLSQNSISGHTGLGIDLAPVGVNRNTSQGAHNFPVITTAKFDTATNTTTMSGSLNSTPVAMFTIEFFSNVSCNSSGYGEGATFLGSTNVTTDGSGNAAFNFSVVGPVLPGSAITTTATDAGGSTSEFSACVTAS